MKLFISGPMTGYEDFNYPAFNRMADKLRSLGYEAINPVELEIKIKEPSWEEYMRVDIRGLTHANGVVVLDGWNESKGSNIEVACAVVMGMPIYKLINDELEQIWVVLNHDVIHEVLEEKAYASFSRR